jgi:hypothetical protein
MTLTEKLVKWRADALETDRLSKGESGIQDTQFMSTARYLAMLDVIEAADRANWSDCYGPHEALAVALNRLVEGHER